MKKLPVIAIDELRKEIDPSPKERHLQSTINILRRELDRIKLASGRTQEFQDSILEAITLREPYPKVYKPNLKSKSVSSPVVPVFTWSDWHIGEVIDENAVEGFNSFNFDIAKKRVDLLVDKFTSWVELHRSNYHIDDIHIIDIGDNISGGIHPELKKTDEFPPTMQMAKAAELKAEAIRKIAAHAKSVTVTFVVPDNHSRMTEKPECKMAGESSGNYIVGLMAKLELQKGIPEKDRDIKFDIITSPTVQVEINGRVYLCEHGDGIKCWNGISYYGIERRASQEAKRRMMNGKGFHKMVLGHFHTPYEMQYHFGNGSLSGTSEFDHKNGRFAEPSQSAWMVHPKYGEFNRINFILNKV